MRIRWAMMIVMALACGIVGSVARGQTSNASVNVSGGASANPVAASISSDLKPTTQPTTPPADDDVSTEPGAFEREPDKPEAVGAKPAEEHPEWGRLGPDLWLDWRNGFILHAPEKESHFRLGGVAVGDLGWVRDHGVEDDTGIAIDDGQQWRRLRLYVSGLVRNQVEFKLQADFAGSGTNLLDAWVRLRNMPYGGDITVGSFRQPFSLQAQTSGLYNTFIERALPLALVPSRGWGIMTHNAVFDQRMTWAAGLPNTARSLNDFTLGLNWFLNGHLRISWNYIHTDLNGSDTNSSADIFLM